MVTSQYMANQGSDDFEPDEGWWASVLADEEGYQSAKAQIQKTSGNAAPGNFVVDWDYIQMLLDQDEIVELTTYGYNRGGLLVQGRDIQGFVPISHLLEMPAGATEEERNHILQSYVNKVLRLKVIECEPSQERVVFSERAAQAGEGKRKQIFKDLRPSSIVVGIVTNVTDFGVFVDLGGLEGLIHVSELSWGRVQHPAEIVHVGSEVKALVLQINEENGRVALSLKRLSDNPWEHILEIYTPGDIVEATVTAMVHFGAFAKLKEGIEGLIHNSSIQNVAEGKLEDMLHIGQQVKVQILHIDSQRRRLGLGLIEVE